MKKMMLLFFLLISGTTFAQQIVMTTGTSQFTPPVINNPYGPNDQINFDYFATNNATNVLFINPTFQLVEDNEVIYEWIADTEPLDDPSNNGSIVFQFPDDCTIPNGEYDLHFIVNYSQPSDSNSPVTYTTQDNDFNTLCNDQNIPSTPPYTSPDCPVFVVSVEFENEESCCSLDPIIDLISIPFHPLYPWKSCKWAVRADLDWGVDDQPKFNAVWNNGHNGLSTTHPCGVEDYFITISWQENGEWCSKVSETIEVRSSCYCAHTIRDLLQVGPVSIDTSMVVSPNPNDGNFNVLLPNTKTASMLEVWNSAGIKILELAGTFENSVPVELGAVEAGIYLLRAQYEDGTLETKQFIVE